MDYKYQQFDPMRELRRLRLNPKQSARIIGGVIAVIVLLIASINFINLTRNLSIL